MVEKCKESQLVLQTIVRSTADDEGLLFEALNLNDELQKVISQFEEMQISIKSKMQDSNDPRESSSDDPNSPPVIEAVDVDKSTESLQGDNAKSNDAELLGAIAESSSDKK